jgi:SAM-dependent methyltransferase
MDIFETWQQLQANELVAYRTHYQQTGNYFGFFSINTLGMAIEAGKTIAKYCNQCLDVGCGVLPRPAYMDDSVTFYGIDPFAGEHKRDFYFVQTIGESLPFRDKVFPCVSFMSTIDHQINPLASLKEAYRVLQPNGYVFIWLELRQDDAAYRNWKNKPAGTLFNDHHQYAFIKKDIEELFTQSNFKWLEMIIYSATIVFPTTQLIIGQKK